MPSGLPAVRPTRSRPCAPTSRGCGSWSRTGTGRRSRAGRRATGLPVEAGETDVERFEALAKAARAALSEGSAAEAEGSLTAALALNRGRPLEGFEDLDAVRPERERLVELRLLAEDDLVQARLDQGRHRELVSELRARVTESPERERPWAQLMLALYRSGRQVEALAAYREAQAVGSCAGWNG
jgi:DNA-binding SARP family transcriptional activator